MKFRYQRDQGVKKQTSTSPLKNGMFDQHPVSSIEHPVSSIQYREASLEIVLLQLEELFVLCRNDVIEFVLRNINIGDVLFSPVKEV